jgi:phospholipid transport system substrate-binding protein
MARGETGRMHVSPRPPCSAARFGLWLVGLVGALAVAPVAGEPAVSPTAQVKQAVDHALQVLQDPALKPESKQPERRRLLRAIADELFDFEEMSRRALGPHWRPLAETQRREFVRLFSDALERAYMSTIERYGGETVLYTAERVDDDYATVSTRIVRKEGNEIPVDYRVLKRNGHWLAYDVSIEGMSLVANYRTQFNTVIQTSSYEELVKRLRSRVEERRAPR